MIILSEDEAAKRIGISVRTLQRWRYEGGGPKFTRLGVRRLGYQEADLKSWAEGRSFASRAAELAQKSAA